VLPNSPAELSPHASNCDPPTLTSTGSVMA